MRGTEHLSSYIINRVCSWQNYFSQLNFLKLIVTAELPFCSKHIWSYFVKRKFGLMVNISMLPSKLNIHHSRSPSCCLREHRVASCTPVCTVRRSEFIIPGSFKDEGNSQDSILVFPSAANLKPQLSLVFPFFFLCNIVLRNGGNVIEKMPFEISQKTCN